MAVAVGVAVFVAVAVLVAVAVAVDVAVAVGVSVEVSVAVAVRVAVAVAVSVAVEVAVDVAVAVGVAVAGGLEFGLVVKSELNRSFSVVPLAALTVPTKYILYRVLAAKPLVGVKVALLPLQVMLPAAISPNPTGLSRKVCLFIDPHFIGRLKLTVILVNKSTSEAPLIGFVDCTTGRGLFDAAAADDPATPRISASIMIETRVTVFLRTIVPCFDSARICPTSTGQGLCPNGAF